MDYFVGFTLVFSAYPIPVVSENAEDNFQGKPAGSLPERHNLDVKSRDLLLRLLEIEPTKRLRSIRVLQTVAFFMGFDFEELKLKTLNPQQILQDHFPNGIPHSLDMEDLTADFQNFESPLFS